MSIKEKIEGAGSAVVDTAKTAGKKIAGGVEHAAEWVAEKAHIDDKSCALKILPHMDVVASCGTKIGSVDHTEGDSIKLTKFASPDNEHHYIPMSWVDHVDTHVHLKKNSVESMSNWKSDAASCASCGA